MQPHTVHLLLCRSIIRILIDTVLDTLDDRSSSFHCAVVVSVHPKRDL